MSGAEDRDGSAYPANARIAGYEVIDEIASGDWGTTYKVRQATPGPALSVTVLSSVLPDSGHVERMRDAVHQASRLRHDHVGQVIDFGQEADRYHVVEAFTEGEWLDRILRGRNPLGSTEALRVAHQLADALAYAHESGVVHGAVSPACVRVRRTRPPRATLYGFASASRVPVLPAALVPYSAPERLTGQPPDAQSDILALGLLIYEMIEGKRFLTGSEDEIKALLLEGTGPLLPRFSRIAPAGVPALIARALRRKPAERQPSMAQFRREIDSCLMRLGEIGTDGEDMVADPPIRRRVAVVVDDALLAPRGEINTTPLRESRVTAAGRPGFSGRRVHVAAAIVVAAVGLALGLPFVEREASAPRPSPMAAHEAATPSPLQPAEPPLPPAEMRGMEAEPAGAPEPIAADAPAAPPAELAVAEPRDPPAPAPVAEPAEAPEPIAADAPAAPATDLALAEPQEAPAVPVAEPVGPSPDKARADVPAVRPALPRPARNRAPRIVSRSPRGVDALSVSEGETVNFGVHAASRNAHGRLTYAWLFDGRKVGGGPGWSFIAPPAVGTTTHTVAVRVSDRTQQPAALVSWKVEITPRMSELNVHDWLGRLASALERKDLAMLRLYGIVTSDSEAELVRNQLPRKRYRVSIANEAIATNGRYARVAFDRAELDERGKLLSARREAYELEKHPGGFVALRYH